MTLANKWRVEARVKTLQTVLLKQLEKMGLHDIMWKAKP